MIRLIILLSIFFLTCCSTTHNDNQLKKIYTPDIYFNKVENTKDEKVLKEHLIKDSGWLILMPYNYKSLTPHSDGKYYVTIADKDLTNLDSFIQAKNIHPDHAEFNIINPKNLQIDNNSLLSRGIINTYLKMYPDELYREKNVGLVINIIYRFAYKGLHIDVVGSSSDIIKKALTYIANQSELNGKFKNLTVALYGPNKNVKIIDEKLAILQDRHVITNEVEFKKKAIHYQSNANDIFTTLFGNNLPNRGNLRVKFKDKMQLVTELFTSRTSSHNCYGIELQEECKRRI